MIDPTDRQFDRIDRILGWIELAAALAAVAALVLLLVLAAVTA